MKRLGSSKNYTEHTHVRSVGKTIGNPTVYEYVVLAMLLGSSSKILLGPAMGLFFF
ncbi:MAG: hypothetical protein RLZZ76_652 [Candidatus Parcubacteria bacterium]|jgi:hypothetical protein